MCRGIKRRTFAAVNSNLKLMKKNLLLFIISLLSVVTTASASDLPFTFQWAHSVDGGTKAGDNTIAMCKSGDYYYIASSFGAANNQDNAVNVWFDGTKLTDAAGKDIVGAGYEGSSSTSYTNNLLLQKVSQDGTVVWTAYSNGGDIDWSGTQMAPLSDGGVVLAVKSRRWNDTGETVCFRYNDPKDKQTEIASDKFEASQYVYNICKINPEGELGDHISITMGLKKYSAATPKNTIYIYGFTTDAEDNIYIGGNFTSTLTLDDTHSYEPRHVDDWDGDVQDKVGEMFVAKYNSNLVLQNVVVEGENTGTADCCQVDKLVYNDGKLYAVARVINGSNIVFGGKTFSTSKKAAPVFMQLSASDLSVNIVNAFTAEVNNQQKYDFKSYGIQYLNGKIYFLGSLNGLWKQDGETVLDNTKAGMLKGSVLQINPETCKVEKAAVRTDGGIGGFYAVYESQSKLYAFGWDFSGGAVIAPLDKETFAFETATQVCNSGIVANATQPIVDGEYFILANRGGKAGTYTNTVSFYGTDTSFSNLKCWNSVYYCYKISDIATAISNTTSTDASAKTYKYFSNGQLFIIKNGKKYNAAGIEQ